MDAAQAAVYVVIRLQSARYAILAAQAQMGINQQPEQNQLARALDEIELVMSACEAVLGFRIPDPMREDDP